MTRSWIGSDLGRQTALPMPVDACDQLPAGHAAFVFVAVVEQLDLSAFLAVYRADGRGRPPFDPKVIVTLILYCRSKGIMSGRDVAAACRDDLGARMITGNRYPKRSTVDRFVKNQRVALKGLLSQTLRLGQAEGLVDVSVVAGDGTYMLANAAMGATVDEEGLLAQIGDLEQKLAIAEAAWLEFVDAADAPAMLFADADGDTHATPPGWPGPGDVRATKARRRVCTLAGMLRSRRAALDHLRTHPNTDLADWADKLQRDQERIQRGIERVEHARATALAGLDRRQAIEANGKRIPGTRPVPVEHHIRVRDAHQALATATVRAEATAANRPTTTRVNTTDPTSRIMPGKHDGFDQRHNVQALACKNQFVIAITTHDSPNDKQALINLILRGRANLDAAGITDPILKALFDNGYASEANFTADLPVEALLVAVEKEARQTQRLSDGASTAAKAWHTMAVRLDEPDNRNLYKQRGAIIEPLFAQLFARFGRNLNSRGDDVETELHLWAVTHNLLKISRRRKARPG